MPSHPCAHTTAAINAGRESLLTDEPIAAHCRALEDCNQRGGRMLSVVDLIHAGTVDVPLGAHLAAAVARGNSFLVGAVPGGAGKTTVMCALLNFVPPATRLVAADSGETVRRALSSRGAGDICYICHEIGGGLYYAYLWGGEARDFFALPRAGHRIATNLHADTLEQCRDQLCRDNGVAVDDFHRCGMCVFLVCDGGGSPRRRRVAAVYESDGSEHHRRVWQWDARADRFEQVGESRQVGTDDPDRRALEELLADMAAKGHCTIEAVRRRFLNWKHPAASTR